jgi:hypothetical protein
MKFTVTTLAVSVLMLVNSLALVQANERDLKGKSDVEGEISIKTDDCKLECEWKAKDDRRLIRNNKIERTSITVGHRKLDVVLKDVECTYEIGKDEYKKDIKFPTGWVIVEKEADGADDYYGFTTTFTVRCSSCSLYVFYQFPLVCIGFSLCPIPRFCLYYSTD